MSERFDPKAPPNRDGAIRFRVRYCECDPMGVAHHAAYAPWFEMGRTELLRPTGVSYADLEAAGILLAVTRLEIRYFLPARYDQLLELRTVITGGGRARLDHEYALHRVDEPNDLITGAPLATGDSTLACIDRQGRPQQLPEWLIPEKRSPRRQRERNEAPAP